MAVGVAFYFEDWEQFSYGADLGAIINRWLINAKAMDIDALAMIDITQFQVGQYYQHNDIEIDFERHTDLDSLLAAYPSVPFVFLERKQDLDNAGITGYTKLADFVHPDPHCIYVFGANSGTINLTALYPNQTWVYVPSKSGQTIYAEEVCAVVMYDRYIKTHVT